MKYLIVVFSLVYSLVSAQVPDGFKPLFNGKNLKGWHVSRSTHQGTTPNFLWKMELLLLIKIHTDKVGF
jgi:hypothetical protein